MIWFQIDEDLQKFYLITLNAKTCLNDFNLNIALLIAIQIKHQ